MSTALHLCTHDDEPALLGLIERSHVERDLTQDPSTRAIALAPLLEGSPYGAAYLMGPRLAPVGYLVITFGWSIELGGMEAWVDEIYVRPNVRSRGIATEVIGAIARVLKSADVKVIYHEAPRGDDKSMRLYERSGFRKRDGHAIFRRDL